jgi:hypothetical protein
MDMGYINRLLWVSIVLVGWGLIGLIADMVKEGAGARITPSGLPGATLLTIGILFGAVGQILIRLVAKIDVLEQRLAKLNERTSASK